MSSQAFYLVLSQCVDRWQPALHDLIQSLCEVAKEVCREMASLLLAAYPALQQAIVEVTNQVLEEAAVKATDHGQSLLDREKEPFTLNSFLQQWVNKLRYDRFAQAVEDAFTASSHPGSNWQGLKDEIYLSMRSWYRETHAVSALASAQEMAGIMEAYWNLSMKRFVDNVCMACDRDLLGTLPDQLQDQLFQYIHEEDRLTAFFTVDTDMLQKKLALEDKKERLVRAVDKLQNTLSVVVSNNPS
jgi:interferon-induced GTP-binding protein Mx